MLSERGNLKTEKRYEESRSHLYDTDSRADFHSGGETPLPSQSLGWIWIFPRGTSTMAADNLLQTLASSTVQGSLTPMPYQIPTGEEEVGTR